MSKTLEEILAPKPAVHPRIYSYAIDDQAHAAAPTARLNSSPGQRPGHATHKQIQALKGRPIVRVSWTRRCCESTSWIAPSGLGSFFHAIPGALPRAIVACPFGAVDLRANEMSHLE